MRAQYVRARTPYATTMSFYGCIVLITRLYNVGDGFVRMGCGYNGRGYGAGGDGLLYGI